MRWALLLGIACAEPAMLEVPADFAERHAAVFRVFEIGPDADALHAHLARVYMGEALTAAHVEHYRTLVALERSDIGVDVLGVDHTAVEADGPDALEASWLVRSAVRHQSHTHVRIGRYRGGFRLGWREGDWRIVEAWPIDMQRVRSGLGAGDVFDEAVDPTERGLVDPLELFEAGAMEGR